jgi:hypothetical protein
MNYIQFQLKQDPVLAAARASAEATTSAAGIGRRKAQLLPASVPGSTMYQHNLIGTHTLDDILQTALAYLL